jgi:hypothetical protein
MVPANRLMSGQFQPEVMVRILTWGVVAVAVAGAALAGCGSQLMVAKEDLQKDISDRLSKAGEPPQSVTCRSDLVGEVGKTTRCEVVVSPTNSFAPIVTVTGVDGSTVHYEMTPALSQEQLQKSVSNLVQQAAGIPVQSVNCESGLEGKEGTEAFCWVDTGGATLRRTVAVTKVYGLLMNYDLIPVLTKAEVETSLLDRLEQERGQRPDSAACTDNLEGKQGNSIDCLVVAGDASQTFAVTVTSVEGNKINYSYELKP